MNFISFTGGVLIAVLMVGAMFIMYSCLNSYQIRMMEQIRKIKNKVYDLEQKLDNQGERLAEVRQYLSKTEPEKTEQPRSTAARPSGSAGCSGTSYRARG
jgi:hypothetical protein